MDSILNITLFNIPLDTLGVKEIVQLFATNNDVAEPAKKYLTYLSNRYIDWHKAQPHGIKYASDLLDSKTSQCPSCNKRKHLTYNPFNKQFLCSPCFGDTWTLTKARKDFKLTDKDLEVLKCITKYISRYRQNITLYNPNDVIGLAMLKHNCTSYKQLNTDVINYIKPNKSKDKRIEQLDKAVAPYSDIKADLMSLPCVTDFMKNGSHGIARIKNAFKLYKPIKNLWADQPPFDKSFDYYMAMAPTSTFLNLKQQIQADYTTYKTRQAQERAQNEARTSRRHTLTLALNARGLCLRDDSTLCRAYINGANDKTIDEIVAIMLEMDFFHSHTNYKTLMQTRMRQAYDDARDMVHNDYGYISDDEEYTNTIEEYLDRNAISTQCKKDALRHFIKHNKNRLSIIPPTLL